MNILFLTREYKHKNFPKCGGTGNFITSISEHLTKRGHNVFVFVVSKKNFELKDNDIFIKSIKGLFYKNLFINLLRSISNKLLYSEKLNNFLHIIEKKTFSKELYKFIETHNLKIDIIETHDFEGFSIYLNKTIPFVVRFHGSWNILKTYFGYKAEKGKINCEKLAFNNIKNCIAISEYSKKINNELFGYKPFKLIYNGIDTDLFKPDDSIEIVNKSIFFFGNITVEKGADTAIDVFLEILKNEPQASLHFVGKETHYKKEILKIIQQFNIEKSVFFHGIQSSENVISLLLKGNVIIFASKGENFSLALLEAMSLSKVVIVSNIESYKEVIIDGENGFIAQSKEDYINKIITVFNNPDLYETIRKSARETVVNQFNINKMINETEKYYREIVERNF